ncbi:hypothetical protein HN51_019602 [Arachis hypogaea]|uniref:C2H2-type domain-containing protein n=1 Tax=Arachis hypogaea TaxID=3818 RepID=A0A445BXI4_ARAHY|nr:zinc finger protein NUTCRACKER [Arachis hypogaea]QHO31393.1 Zinc finger protein MAGPIE [Arachis hypogaea]RYR43445.1 hypothetical protein Ahy_A08g039859 [Arachis hypogaea]
MDDGEVSNAAFPLHHNNQTHHPTSNNPPPLKRKRNLPGNPDPEAEVIALSPKTLMATNRFVCEICLKGFQRDQNLQLHRRGHNLPWKLKQRTTKEVRKRVYVCPEKSCVHNHPSRALGDLTGIKKHFCRKHGEKKWKCDKCSKRYAVQSDWKAHSKTCGTREYKCDCGTIFSRRDSFITHRAFCDALAEETARVNAASTINHTLLGANNIAYTLMQQQNHHPLVPNNMSTHFSSIFKPISSSTTDEISSNSQTSSRPLSLWNMGHHPHDTTTIMPITHNNLHDIHHQIGFATNPPPPSIWMFGNKHPSNGSQQEIITSTTSANSLPLMNIVKNNNNNNNSNNNNNNNHVANQLVSVPSLYSTQHQSHDHDQTATTSSSAANMSATALLQKAAQIGSTSSTDPSSFLGSIGLKCSNNNNQGQDGNNKFCGIYSSSWSEPESSTGDLTQMPPTKRMRVQNEDGSAGGQTRDFLGVGVQTICHPSSITGWI